MKNLPKILVVLAIIAASLYFVHRLEQCSIAGVQPAPVATPGGPAAVSAPSAATADLVYPDAKAREALRLGYEVYQAHGDGTYMVLPLPPGTALRTTLSLQAQKPALKVEMADARCAAPVQVRVYRADRREPVAERTLQAGAKSGPVRLPLEALEGLPALLTFEMATEAKNNWNCNLTAAWVE